MVDSIDSLAFSMQANPGVYALLIGSGVSRAAEIPTGWEITLDLIRKLAKMKDESAESNPKEWYCEKYKEEPEYSKIIDELAKTQSERQQLLRPYFEPSQQEREENENTKQPTAAHRAIARLVAKGFVKVILTTNFDRLIENSLKDEGVEPTVLTSLDQVKGMVPLVHTPPCVIKLHGDYRDTRILNTTGELENYPPEFNKLLDQIFDEFGLVVCGWSAKWDTALKKALERALSRRFTTYWTIHGEISGKAERLVKHRSAEMIQISDADKFFETIQQKVDSIEQFSQPHPLSVSIAVESMKRYLSEPRYRIKLSDLIADTVGQVVDSVSNLDFDMHVQSIDTNTVTERFRAYEAACSPLLGMASIGGHWVEKDHFDLWQKALVCLATMHEVSENSMWIFSRLCTTAFLLYALGLGAISSNKSNGIRFISHILSTNIDELYRLENRDQCIDSYGKTEQEFITQFLFAHGRLHADQLSIHISKTLRNHIKNISNDAEYDLIFNKLEIFIALNLIYHEKSLRGCAAFRSKYAYKNQNTNIILGEIDDSIRTHRNNSRLVKNSIFGEDAEECLQSLDDFKNFLGI